MAVREAPSSSHGQGRTTIREPIPQGLAWSPRSSSNSPKKTWSPPRPSTPHKPSRASGPLAAQEPAGSSCRRKPRWAEAAAVLCAGIELQAMPWLNQAEFAGRAGVLRVG
jgi:hypothetical protein